MGVEDRDWVYLDHAASAPVRPEALDAMLPFLTSRYGNPSGAHALARDARRAVDDARDVIAAALGFRPSEIVFTSGGTEADNLAVLGSVAGPGVVCSAIEHHAVLDPVLGLGGRTLPVTAEGLVDLDAIEHVVEPGDGLVSVMLANNEVGVIQPLAAIVERVRARAPGAVIHTDAVQALPWIDVASQAAGVELVAISAHKVGGPKGTGALAVRSGTRLRPRAIGGGQERGRRSGTHDVAGIAGMAAAVQATIAERADTVAKVGTRRDRLVEGLLAAVPDVVEVAPRATRVAGNAHVCARGVDGEALLLLLEEGGILASVAASCSSGATEPSHVLSAMGVPRELAAGSLRLSLGWTSSDADVEQALAVIPRAVERLRSHGGG